MTLKDETDRNFNAMPGTPVKTCTQHFSIFMDHPGIEPDDNNSDLDADEAMEIDSDPVVNSGEVLEMLVFSKSMSKTTCYVVTPFTKRIGTIDFFN